MTSLGHCHRVCRTIGNTWWPHTGFVEKNKDVLFKDLIAVMQGSDVPYIVNLFPDDISVRAVVNLPLVAFCRRGLIYIYTYHVCIYVYMYITSMW